MWLQEKTSELIELYRKEKVLWDPADVDFKDRQRKHEAWESLAAACDVSKDEVEAKMRKLIGQFQRELKKGKRGDSADAPYKTKWSFFHSLLFLREKYEPRYQLEAGLCSLQADPLSEDMSQSCNYDQQIVVSTLPEIKEEIFEEDSLEEDVEISSPWSSLKSTFQPSQPHPTPKRKSAHEDSALPNSEDPKRARDSNRTCDCLLKPTSHSNMLANVWAVEFEKLETEQQLFAKKFIDDILFEGRMGNLNRYSVAINHSGPTSSYSGPPPDTSHVRESTRVQLHPR